MEIRRINILIWLFLFIFAPSFSSLYGATLSKPANNLGLVGYWSFNEATGTVATDFSGRGNSGILTNISAPASATSGWNNGKFGAGINFDGTNDYVSIANGGGLNALNTGTISMWVRWSGSQDQDSNPSGIYGAVMARQSNGSFTNQLIALDGADPSTAKVTFSPYLYSATKVTASTAVGNNVWRHIVVTYQNGSQTIYLDGKQDGSGTFSGGMSNDTSVPLTIGAWIGDGGSFSTASVDEVRVYNRILGTNEISKLYNYGLIKFNSSKNEVVKNGLVGHWTFDSYNLTDKVYDVSGNSNNGYFQGGSTSTAKTLGKIGQAMNFDGVNDMINAGSGSTLDDLPGLTYMGWIKPRSAGGGRGTLFSKTNTSTPQGLTYVYFDNVTATNGISFLRDTVTTDIGYTTTNNVVSLNEWAHVAVSWNGTANTANNVRIYINGVESSYQINDTGTGTLESDAGNDFTIGGRMNIGSERYFDGLIDDVRVYNRAVSAAEVKQIYNATAGSKINAPQNNLGQSSLNTGLVDLLSFNSKDFSDKVYDRSSSANHGYVYNSATSTTKTIGKSGQGIIFDGVNDFVWQNLSSLGTLTSGTVSMWLYRNRSSTYEMIIETPVSNLSFEGDSLISMWIGNGCQTDFTGLTTGVWTHLVGTWDGSNSKSYINGSLVSNVACSNSATMASFSIGARYDGGLMSLPFSGKMDELRIYNRALTATEVKQLYLIGR